MEEKEQEQDKEKEEGEEQEEKEEEEKPYWLCSILFQHVSNIWRLKPIAWASLWCISKMYCDIVQGALCAL